MNDFIKMDVFFVVTTVAVIVLSTLVALILLRVLRILEKAEGFENRIINFFSPRRRRDLPK